MKSESPCYHCGLEVGTPEEHTVEIDGATRDMCCLGCQAVAEAIVSEGLSGYYQHRTQFPEKPEELIPKALERLTLYDRAEVQQSFVISDGTDTKEATLIIEGIVCAACVWLSEKHINQIKGVQQFSVNYTTHRAHAVWDDSKVKLSDILHAISDIGYLAHPFNPDVAQEIQAKQKSKMMRQMVVAGLGMMQAMMMAVSMYLGAEESPDLFHFLRMMSWLVATPVVLYSAQVFFKPAWRDLKSGHLGMDVPVSIAIILAYGASVWAIISGTGEVYFDSVSMFVFFLLIGRFLEQSARHKAGESIESQAKVLPAIATIVQRDDPDTLVDIPVVDIQRGDIVVVRAGDIIPVDGMVSSGKSSVDESILTGESMPRPKTIGDIVVAGSMNIESTLHFKVEKIGAETTMASILRLLDKAQNEKPRIATITNQVAIWFVSLILLLAIGTGWYWYLQDPTQIERALWIVVSVLVVTCPCALSLATPVALVVATGNLSKKGLLIRKGNALETLAKTTDMVFDKTGTLTQGNLHLEKIEVFSGNSEEEILGWATALEAYSEHPIAKVFSTKNNHQVKDIKVQVGKGISGVVSGKLLRIGTFEFVTETAPTGNQEVDIQIFIGTESELLAQFVLRDTLRSDASTMVKALKELSVTPHLYSGDRQEVTKAVADKLNIADAQGDLLPEDKLHALYMLQEQNKVVAMCGDGINDAPVLAGADVSIAMGEGTNLAKGHSDMILMSPSLRTLSEGVQIAKKTMTVIKQNIAWAVLYNMVALPLAMAGWIAPWMAAIGMSFSSLLVVLNALRLMGSKKT